MLDIVIFLSSDFFPPVTFPFQTSFQPYFCTFSQFPHSLSSQTLRMECFLPAYRIIFSSHFLLLASGSRKCHLSQEFFPYYCAHQDYFDGPNTLCLLFVVTLAILSCSYYLSVLFTRLRAGTVIIPAYAIETIWILNKYLLDS